MVESFFNLKGRAFEAGEGLPLVSTQLDSVRSYQWEAHFTGLPLGAEGTQQTDLTIAAKQVSPIGMGVEDIEVHRLNDKVFYPGKPNHEELVITFDNLYLKQTSKTLWDWFKNIYDPLSGKMTKEAAPGGAGGGVTFKANKLEIIQLDNSLTPHSTTEVYGVYPKTFKMGELNYSTNEFHTIEVTFRYDFMDQFNF